MDVFPTRNRSPAPPGRWWVGILAIALAGHAILLWVFVRRVLKIRYPVDPLAAEFAYVALPTLACAALLLWRFPRHALAVATAMIFLAAAALVSPGVVLTVGAMALCAYVVGERAIALLREPGREAPAQPPAAALLIVGASLWMGLIAATLQMRIHVMPVYAVLGLLPLVAFRRVTAAAVAAFARWLAAPREPLPWTERAWVAVLVVVAVMHLFLVARPEVGYDAQTMHLHFAQLLREHRQWTFDVTRYIWAVMPLGADLGFAAAYLLAGEGAAKFLNFAFGVLMLVVVYRLLVLYARRDIALAIVALLASTPLVFAESATLYVENLWIACLLAALLLALRFSAAPGREALCAFAFAAAGAMQCKIIGAIWLAPLCGAVALLAWTRRERLAFDGRTAALLALAAALAAWPYLNAWARTGNPAFPFVNALFGSPWFDTSASFNNQLYNAPLKLSTPWQIVLSSRRFIEGTDGALGAWWLLLIPVAIAGLARRRATGQWLSLALAAFFFVVVYLQQSYLRYLLPALVLFAVFAGWVLQDLPDTPRMRIALLAAGAALCVVNVRMMPAASHTNARLCIKCSYDPREREAFVRVYAPHRVLSEYLNRTFPRARVGFLLLNAESPSGYVGDSRSGNWHDWPMYRGLVTARDADDIGRLARAHRLSHIVYSASETGATNDAIRAFASRHATPVWRSGDYVVAALNPG